MAEQARLQFGSASRGYSSICYDESNQTFYALNRLLPTGTNIFIFNSDFSHRKTVLFPFEILYATVAGGKLRVFYAAESLLPQVLMQELQL